MIILGIDIGGSGMKAAKVNVTTGQIVSDRFRIATPKPATPDVVADTVCQILDHFEWNGPVGVSFPTIVKNGKASSSGNLDKEWKKTRIDKLFSKRCGQEFFVVNDADAAGMAEMKYGAGKNKDGLVITITIGTGLGSGVFFNGELLRNFELGTVYGKDGKLIEIYAADSARKREDLSYEEWGKRFNFFLKYIDRIMHPDLFILGGGVSKKMDRFEQYLTVKTPVVPAKNLNNAGIIGAAVFAADQILN